MTGRLHQRQRPSAADGSDNRTRVASIDRLGMTVLLLVVAAAYLWAYRANPAHPHIGGDKGWWNWFDQSWYFRAATAWSDFRLDPGQHLYLPGYALLAAPFVGLLSVHAFAIPDLLCLLISLWLFAELSVRLLPRDLPHPRLIGGMVFALAALGSPSMREVWVVPWSTTGSIPFVYGALLAAICFIERPGCTRLAFWVGLAGGCVAGFRPSDAIPVLLASCTGMLLALIVRRAPLRTMSVGAAWGLLGLACAILVTGLPYLAIYGLHKSHYVFASGQIGFEWRFLPLHWVMLGLDPRPLIDDGSGLIEAFPWMPFGLAACLIQLAAPPRSGTRLIHLVVAIAACLHIALYLCYRDLYPEGFFRYWNYHYYKWVMPVLALYAVILAHDVVRGPRRAVTAILALVGLAVMLPWRAQLGQVTTVARGPSPDPAHILVFESRLGSIRDVMLVAAAADWNEIYRGTSTLAIGDRSYADHADYKLLPAPGGFLLIPLRPLATGIARLTVGPDLRLDPSVPLLHARQQVALGLPCWLPEQLKRCRMHALLPSAFLPISGTISFDGNEAQFLDRGWSAHEPAGRWTDGGTAILSARVPANGHMPLQLRLTASAYVPPGSPPLIVHATINGYDVGIFTFSDGQTVTVEAPIKPEAFNSSPIITLKLLIDNPRLPASYDPKSSDDRQLGLFVRRLEMTASP